MSDIDIDVDDLLHVGDAVRHVRSGMVGKVTGFAHDGTINVMVDGTGPYPQQDFERLAPEPKVCRLCKRRHTGDCASI